MQCSSGICEPKYTHNSHQPNTRIRVCIYAHLRIQYMCVCLISMYERTCCFLFSLVIVVFNGVTAWHRAREIFIYFEYVYTRYVRIPLDETKPKQTNIIFAIGHTIYCSLSNRIGDRSFNNPIVKEQTICAKYSESPLIQTPRGHAKMSVLTGCPY